MPRAFAEWSHAEQIHGVLQNPPLTLTAPGFPLRALALLAARAPLGGPRETLLGVLQASRLTDGVVGSYPLAQPQRRVRAAAARSWLAALAMPAAARQAIGRTIDASAHDDRAVLTAAWSDLVQVVSPLTDQAARNELRRIGAALQGSP